MTDTINFSFNKWEKFRKTYIIALENDLKSFKFEGEEYTITRAKYLIDKLEEE